MHFEFELNLNWIWTWICTYVIVIPREKVLWVISLNIVGCMAERLKMQIVEKEKAVDIVCGPDAYKDLPRMLSLTESGQVAGTRLT